MVAVISHLHAVAEAVEDVLWVERGPTGSTARWLSPGERDRLVREEVTAGLLSLLWPTASRPPTPPQPANEPGRASSREDAP